MDIDKLAGSERWKPREAIRGLFSDFDKIFARPDSLFAPMLYPETPLFAEIRARHEHLPAFEGLRRVWEHAMVQWKTACPFGWVRGDNPHLGHAEREMADALRELDAEAFGRALARYDALLRESFHAWEAIATAAAEAVQRAFEASAREPDPP